MRYKQALLNITGAAKDNKWVAITIAMLINVINIWIVFAVGHLIPIAHWADTPYSITAFIWVFFVAAMAFGLCIEHHGDS